MEKSEQFLDGAGNDPEATLVTPRFDAEETVTARPVVSLAESPAQSSRRGSVTVPFGMLLIAALLGGVVSVFGLYF